MLFRSRPRVNTGFDELDDFLATLVARRLEDRPTSAKAVSVELARLDADLSRRSTQVAYQAPVDLSTRKLPARPQPAPTTDQALVALQQPRRVWPVLLALSFAVLVLSWWGWARMSRDELPKVPTIETPRVEVVPPVVPVIASPEPLAAVVPDSGEILEPLTKVPRITKPVIASAMCTFDDRFRDYARQVVAELRTVSGGGAKFDKLEDDVGAALVDRDCKRVNQALSGMRRVAGVREDE